MKLNQRSEIASERFREISRLCKQVMRAHVAKEEEDQVNMNAKHFYLYVSNKLHPENKRIVLESNGNMVTNEQEISKLFAAEFATNFASSVSDMSSNGRDIRSEVQQNNTPCFNQINIDIGTVR